MILRIKYFYLIFLIALPLVCCGFSKTIDPIKEKKLLTLVLNILKKNHYNAANLDDKFSKDVFRRYLKAIDPNNEFLLESDIDYFKKYETKIDDLLKTNDLTFFYITYDRAMMRLKEYKEIYAQVVKTPNDFFINDYRNVDSLNFDFPASKSDLKNKCRLKIKHFVLDRILEKLDAETEIKNKNSKYTPKDFSIIEKESRELSLRKIDRSFLNIDNVDRDYFFSKFINAALLQNDPHTKYFRPEELSDLNLQISGKGEGVGVVWGYNNNYIEVRQLIINGPAWKEKNLEVGDLILKVAEANEDQVDVVGYSLYDLLKLSKNKKKGTIVKYTVQKPDGSIKIISIKRDIYDLTDNFMQSCIIEHNKKKFGFINLQKFYKEINVTGDIDVAKDVAAEIQTLKKQGIQGLIFDIRNNIGGSLESAIEIAGFFVENAPILQIKSSTKKLDVLSSKNTKPIWDGPLVVLTNNQTAAAAEIFAAAIQDYHRGLIIGSNNTYGSGTVQELIDLNQYNSKKTALDDDGILRLTEKEYYRVNGESIQIKGVTSDIKIPTIQDTDVEKNLPTAILWNKIEPTQYKPVNNKNDFDKVISNSENRIVKNKNFQLIQAFIEFEISKSNESEINLNLEKYDKNRVKIISDTQKFKNLKNLKNNLKLKNTPAQVEFIKKDIFYSQKRYNWFELLSKDIYIEESANVLTDMLK